MSWPDIDSLVVDRDALWWTPEGYVEGSSVDVREDCDLLPHGVPRRRFCWAPEAGVTEQKTPYFPLALRHDPQGAQPEGATCASSPIAP